MNNLENRPMQIFNNIPDNLFLLTSANAKAHQVENEFRRTQKLLAIEEERKTLLKAKAEYQAIFVELADENNNAVYFNVTPNGLSHVAIYDRTMVVLERESNNASKLIGELERQLGFHVSLKTAKSIKDFCQILRDEKNPPDERLKKLLLQKYAVRKNYFYMYDLEPTA